LNANYIYKIPVGNNNLEKRTLFICFDTNYFTNILNYFSHDHKLHEKRNIKFTNYKPIYFNKFKYIGKGFKLIFKKKKKLFNCIFGYSHIYWVKLQNVLVKKTKKYKFFFATKNINNYNIFVNILKKIKPINRYTLRGVRTYTHKWVKRKGRKSVATHV